MCLESLCRLVTKLRLIFGATLLLALCAVIPKPSPVLLCILSPLTSDWTDQKKDDEQVGRETEVFFLMFSPFLSTVSLARRDPSTT